MDSETFLSGHTAAGTAPEFHRIPFLICPFGKDGAKPNFNAKLLFLMLPAPVYRIFILKIINTKMFTVDKTVAFLYF